MKKKRALFLSLLIHSIFLYILKYDIKESKLLQENVFYMIDINTKATEEKKIENKKNKPYTAMPQKRDSIISKKSPSNTIQSLRKKTDKTFVNPKALLKKKNISKATLVLAGWQWEKAPSPQDETKENGKIVFQIKVDAWGEIIAIRTIEKTVSNFLEEKYRQALEETLFLKDDEERESSEESVGKVTFFIESK